MFNILGFYFGEWEDIENKSILSSHLSLRKGTYELTYNL